MAFQHIPRSISLADWQKQNSNQNVEYKIREEQPSSMSFYAGNNDEMIRIDKDGFYIRGKKVLQDDKEAEVVYNAFKQWLVWANLQRGN